jgi:DegV family protein with EDD domain
VECFDRIVEAGGEAVVITLSSKLSGTYSAAVTAAEEAGAGRITVIDSKFVSFGQGLLVLKAAEMAREGMSREDIVNECERLMTRLEMLIFVDTLTYLHKGGRLSAGEAVIGGLLSIKPVLCVKDGALAPLDKVRGRKKTLKWFEQYLQEHAAEMSEESVGFFHAADPIFMEEMIDVASSVIRPSGIYRSTVGAVVGTHSGPGCVAFAYFRK